LGKGTITEDQIFTISLKNNRTSPGALFFKKKSNIIDFRTGEIISMVNMENGIINY